MFKSFAIAGLVFNLWMAIFLVKINPVYAPIYDFTKVQEKIEKRNRLWRFFKVYGSPEVAKDVSVFNCFVSESSRLGFDYTLLPAISFVESSGFKNYPKQTNNGFGFGSGEPIGFGSHCDCIRQVGRTIGTKAVYKKWQKTGEVEDLARVYATDPQWSTKVRYWMNKIKNF